MCSPQKQTPNLNSTTVTAALINSFITSIQTLDAYMRRTITSLTPLQDACNAAPACSVEQQALAIQIVAGLERMDREYDEWGEMYGWLMDVQPEILLEHAGNPELQGGVESVEVFLREVGRQHVEMRVRIMRSLDEFRGLVDGDDDSEEGSVLV